MNKHGKPSKLKFTYRKKDDPEKDVRRSINIEFYKQFRPFRIPLIIIQIFIAIGTLIYLVLEDYDIMHAFFQTVYTFTGTGFGSLNEDKFGTISIIFSSFLMVCGAGVITFSMAFIISIFNESSLLRLAKERRMVNAISRLHNHFVICYHNEYTIELSKRFRESHVSFVVVDNSPNFEQEAKKYHYPYYIIGDPHTQASMLKTHLSSAKGLITFSPKITDNIALITSTRLFERELEREKRPFYVISCAQTQEEIDRLKKLGASFVVSASRLLAQRISTMAVRPDVENLLEGFLYKNDNQLDLEEFIVPKYSWVNMRKIKDIRVRDIVGVAIVGITQKDGDFIAMPDSEVVITSESKLLLIGTQDNIRHVKHILSSKQYKR